MSLPSNNRIVHGVIGVIHDGGRLLLIQRAAGVRVPHAWCFPGGHVEPGESQAEAVVREMREELELHVAPLAHLLTHIKHDGRLHLHCWSVEIVAGIPTPNPLEVAEFLWMTPSQIRTHHGMLPGTAEILERMGY